MGADMRGTGGAPPKAFAAGGARGPRAEAARIVAAWLRSGVFPDRLLERHPDRGRAAARELVFNAVKWRRTLEWRIGRVTRRFPRNPGTAAILLTAAAELFRMDNSPPHAVVHAAVNMVRRMAIPGDAGFVNAVLRAMLRDRAAADAALARLPPPLRWSHPDVLWRRWERRFGAEGARRLCEWNNARAGVALYLRKSRVSMETFLARLLKAGIEAVPHPARPADSVRLPRGVAVEDVPGFAEGDFSIQDPATLAATDLLAVRPGERVLDACAAPGGKTAVLAEHLGGRGALTALDIDPGRIRILNANLRRLGHSGVVVVEADLTALQPAGREALRAAAPDGFDAVLLDAPCSNTGVLQRRPDARWRFDPAILSELVRRQNALLNAGAGLVKPGGRIVYSTCSLEAEENEVLIKGWLEAHTGFRLAGETAIFPPDNLSDGAYAAKIVC